MGRLLVSVRGPNEAVAAAQGGAHIADVEYPASALGTPYLLTFGHRSPIIGILRQSHLNVIEQSLRLDRLFEEAYRSSLHGIDGHGDVPMTRDDDNWDRDAVSNEPAVQIDTAHAWEPHIQDQAAGTRGRSHPRTRWRY